MEGTPSPFMGDRCLKTPQNIIFNQKNIVLGNIFFSLRIRGYPPFTDETRNYSFPILPKAISGLGWDVQ